ncbi:MULTISPECIES: hypothetical protein [Mycobacterium]|uniref:hypothetical protein n=1 Tax=Mycobacterium TaxID=1763 RepID=UPI001EF09E68|nr:MULTISPECIES: hypothetical protein [Mycobacterium]BDB42242.1 putative lipoprotein LppK [Mycobacterium kiyosense]GLD07875.1 putative lipoprotein LppK [Mycobacterium kiyosense]GLD19752.1 putative lipoprotein LppK [Mycobacterium kiyosense]GLD26177.1 putative lipoprotein LppK [Mycobacterium kiyosense]
MSRNLCVTLGAAVVVAVLALAGCSRDTAKKMDSAQTAVPPAPSSTVAAAPTAPLPAPEILSDVLSRLADAAVPGNDKLNLVQGAGPETAGALDRFTTAARDGGYLPMTFVANNIAWSSQNPSNATATVVVHTANPDHREFTFPMEFTSTPGGWQLSRKTAEMLLAMQNAGTLPPTSPPAAPAPNPAPPPGPEAGPPASPSPTP